MLMLFTIRPRGLGAQSLIAFRNRGLRIPEPVCNAYCMSTENTADRIRYTYGVQETNGLADGHAYHAGIDYDDALPLAEVAARGGHITRVRLLTEYWPSAGKRHADISYIHATLPDGKIVPVTGYPGACDLYGPRGVKAEFIAWANAQGVNAKRLGLLDEANWSVLK